MKMHNCDQIRELKCFAVLLLQVSQPLLLASSSPSTERTSWVIPEIWERDASATVSSCHGCVSLSSWSAQSYMSTCARGSERKKKKDGNPLNKSVTHVNHFPVNRRCTRENKMNERRMKYLLKWYKSVFFPAQEPPRWQAGHSVILLAFLSETQCRHSRPDQER